MSNKKVYCTKCKHGEWYGIDVCWCNHPSNIFTTDTTNDILYYRKETIGILNKNNACKKHKKDYTNYILVRHERLVLVILTLLILLFGYILLAIF